MTRKRTTKTKEPAVDKVGLVGLGLMGRGIATCLLANGLEVVAWNRTASRARAAAKAIEGHVQEVEVVVPRRRVEDVGISQDQQRIDTHPDILPVDR